MLMEHIFMKESFGQDWFTYPSLYGGVVKKYPSGSKFVEVGSWKGKSSAYMAVEIANSEKDIEFYCVDHWLGNEECYDSSSHAYEPNIDKLYDIFIENMKPLSQYYKPIKMPSVEAAKTFSDKSLDFIFIDASHEYEDVKNDILAWASKLKDGGIFAGHDIGYEPVKRAVDEVVGKDNYSITSEQCWVVNDIKSINS